MKVLFDVTSLMREGLTGVGVYIAGLFDALARHPGVELDPVWRLSRFKRRELIARHISQPARPYIPILSGVSHGSTIYHGPDFRIPRRGSFRKVVTVHDLVVHEDGLVDERFAMEGREKLRRTLLECRPDAIITVSGFTRDRLLEIYPQLAPITHAVPLGISPERLQHDPELEQRWKGRNYILSAGSVEKRKNLAATIRAFEMVRDAGNDDLELIVAGGGGHGAEAIHSAVAGSSYRNAIHLLGYVSDAELAALYRNARCFLYPSLYEGFGLPILEAMAAGAPVITSNIGAMAEVAADAALLADPRSPEDIAQKIGLLIDDPMLRARLAAAGARHAARFTWERCAEGTIAVYRALI